MRDVRYALAAALVFSACGVFATSSDAIRVQVADREFSFWRTLPSEAFDLHFDFPDGATTATLTVKGGRCRKEFTGITASPFRVTADMLPGAGFDDENVFSLTLSFDKGEPLTATGLGRVAGVGTSAATLRVRLGEADAAPWTAAGRYNVLPIPAGTSQVSVNGEASPWTGEQGWYLLGPLSSGAATSLALDDGNPVAVTYESTSGLLLIVR